MPRPVGKSYGTAKSVRLAMARIIEDYRLGASEYEISEYRTIVWSFVQLLSALRLEKDVEIERRIEAIEAALAVRAA